MSRHLARTAAPTASARPGDFAYVMTAAALWAMAAIIGTMLGQEAGLPPATVAFLRMGIGGVGLLVTLGMLGGLRGQPWGRAVDVRILLTAVGLAIYEGCFFAALRELSVSLAVFLIMGTTPVAVAAWHALTARRLPSVRVLVAMVLALAGMAVMLLGSGTVTVTVAGVVLSLVAGLGFALQIVVNDKPVPGLSPYVLTGAAYTLACTFIAPFAIVQGLDVPRTGAGIGLLALLVVFGTIAAYVAYLRGLRTVPGTQVAVIVLAEPVIAMIAGVLVLGESVTVTGLAGAAAVAAAVVLLRPAPSSLRAQ